jgi:soluble lytic murein transglycosylase-like protein
MIPTLALLAALTMTPQELLIRHVAGAMGVNADYAVCIAWHESKLDPRAVGTLGEEGMFQILPSTGEWIAETWGWECYDGFDPATNTMMGVWLLRQGYDDWFSTKRFCIKEYQHD